MGAPSKLESLLRLARRDRVELDLTLAVDAARRAGDLDAAIGAGKRLIATLRDHLEQVDAHDRTFCEPGDAIDPAPIVRRLVNASTTQADHLQSRGDRASAERLRDEAQALARARLGASDDFEEMRRRALALESQGRLAEALTALFDVRDFFAARNQPLPVARVTIDLADLLQWCGDFDRASRELERAEALVASRLPARAFDPMAMLTDVMAGISEIQGGTGDGARAVEAVELNRIATELDYYRGLVAKGRGDFEAADAAFARVRPAYAQVGAAEAIDWQHADVARRSGDPRRCLEITRRLEPHFRRDQNFRPKLAALLLSAGESNLALGDAHAALEQARAAVRDLEQFHDPDLRWKAEGLEARTLKALGDGAAALAAWKNASATIAGLRMAPLGYRLDATYLRDKRPLFDDAIRAAFELGEFESFCEFSEEIKSRNLGLVLSGAPAAADRADSRTASFDDLSRRIDALEFQRYSAQGDARVLALQRERLVAERGELLERLRVSDPRWRALTLSGRWSLADLEARLEGIAVVTLVQSGDRILAALLTAKERRLASTPLSNELVTKLESYAANLQSHAPDPQGYDASVAFAIGAKHLIDPAMLESVLSHDALVVIPHGVLHLLPWAGLIFEGRRLFERLPVGVLPSLRSVAPLRAAKAGPTRGALVGAPDYAGFPGLAPLAAAEREIEELRRLYSDRQRLVEPVLTGRRATEAAFVELVGRDELEGATLHVACHGMPEPSEPLASGLLMTGSRVDASEISRLRLRCADVVLSACQTGWRPTQIDGIALAGDEILGLPAAFLEAGASSVLVSIPEADDAAAAELTLRYHRRRLSGETPLRSLQSAQKEMLATDHEPWSWIGFSLYGCR